MKIVVRGTNWIGDAVMTIPALRSLRVSFPQAEIALLTRSWAEGVFRDADFVDRIIAFEPSRSTRRDLAVQRRLLRDEGFHLAVLFTNSFESALAVNLARIPARIGYAKEGRGVFLTDAIAVPDWKKTRHETHYYLNLVAEAARRFGGNETAADGLNHLPVSQTRRDAATGFLRAHGIDDRPIVVLGVGSTNSNAKRWPAARYAELCDILAARLGAKVVLMGSREELEVAEQVVLAAREKPIVLTGQTNLAEAVALLSVADLLVSNDTGLAHVAPAVGTKTLVIFGPTDDRTTRPIGSEIIRKPFDCAPCMLRECPIDHRCMASIAPEEVFERAAAMLGKLNQ